MREIQAVLQVSNVNCGKLNCMYIRQFIQYLHLILKSFVCVFNGGRDKFASVS